MEEGSAEDFSTSVAAWWAVVRGLVPGRVRTLVCMLISRLVSTPPYISCWQSRFPSKDISELERVTDGSLGAYDVPVLNGNIPVTR